MDGNEKRSYAPSSGEDAVEEMLAVSFDRNDVHAEESSNLSHDDGNFKPSSPVFSLDGDVLDTSCKSCN